MGGSGNCFEEAKLSLKKVFSPKNVFLFFLEIFLEEHTAAAVALPCAPL
jgi:hypothetical protein